MTPVQAGVTAGVVAILVLMFCAGCSVLPPDKPSIVHNVENKVCPVEVVEDPCPKAERKIPKVETPKQRALREVDARHEALCREIVKKADDKFHQECKEKWQEDK